MTNYYHNHFFAMGTRCHVVLPGMDDDFGEQIFSEVRNEVNRLENSLSRFLPESEISLINQNAGGEEVSVSPEVFHILQVCKQYYDVTGGAFDITLLPLLQYWKDKAFAGIQDGAADLMHELGTNRMHLDTGNRTVRFENQTLGIDLGGFGKGYALDQVGRLLKKQVIWDAFISFGESSILTLGRHPAGDHWKVGVNDYLNPGNALHSFTMNDGSVSTSSNFFVDDHGTLHNKQHIINPFTGCPLEALVSVSVCSESAIVSEVLSTAMLVSEDEQLINTVKNEYSVQCVRMDYTGGTTNVTTL